MLVPIRKDQTTTCISMSDDAVDYASCEMAKHPRTGEDVPKYVLEHGRKPASWRDTVAIKDGEKPTEFIIGIIPASELVRIEDECRCGADDERTRELAWRCFLAGVRDIKALDGVEKYTVDGLEYVKPSWLRDTFVGSLRGVACEIGLVIWTWNQLAGSDVKN